MEINVNKVEDSFYRYKMPKLLAKVEGKGNGIKTVIVNMSDIAKSLYRKPSYPTKYFGFELGAQIKLDEKHDRYIVNGSHDAGKLQEVLFGFIKKFVLCQSCGNPETSLFVKKPNLYYKCRACGHSDQLDPTHRLTPFILKNPPENESEGALVEHNTTNSNIDECNEIECYSNVKENEELTIECLSIKDTYNEIKSNITIFREFIEDLFNTRNLVQSRDKVGSKAKSLDIGPEFLLIVMEVVFCNRDTIIDDVEIYKSLFLYFTRRGVNDETMQKYVLEGMERLIESFNLIPKSCHFLKALYDNDIVEEGHILEWYENKNYINKIEISQSIREECKKMIEWLLEADEESDD